MRHSPGCIPATSKISSVSYNHGILPGRNLGLGTIQPDLKRSFSPIITIILFSVTSASDTEIGLPQVS